MRVPFIIIKSARNAAEGRERGRRERERTALLIVVFTLFLLLSSSQFFGEQEFLQGCSRILINFESEIRIFSAKNLECQRKLNSVATGAAAGRC